MSWQNAVLFASVALAVAGVMVDSSLVVYAGLVLAGVFGFVSIKNHKGIGEGKRLLLFATVLIITPYLIWVRYSNDLAKELKEKEGLLIPAWEPNPLSKCPVPEDATALYFGTSVAWTKNFPHVVFRVRGQDVFVINRDSGGARVTFKVFDERGDLVAKVEDNKFIATNAASHMERPDRSTLRVFDHADVLALQVRFINPKTIYITGVLRYPGIEPIVIERDYVELKKKQRFFGSCFGGAGIDFDIE
jgi:hypothetical protein